MNNENISHYDLCKLTAKRFLMESEIVLYEYQSWACGEFPDVLCFNGWVTKLFEIKIDYQDFKKDKLKDCRREIDIKCWPSFRFKYYGKQVKSIIFDDSRMDELIKEAPHLGRQRYYVCPKDLIQPEETGDWGLYWYYNNKFYKRKKSKQFKNAIHQEMNILSHAFRKYANNGYKNISNTDNILIKEYI